MAFDQDAYLARIGFDAVPTVDLNGLTTIHTAQLRAIPFENLDVLMQRGIDVHPNAVFEKLVRAQRGGYCFECNGLLCGALQALGFSARLLLARVVLRSGVAIPALTHAVVLVELDGQHYVADAGFGGRTPRAPMTLVDGAEAAEGELRWRLARDAQFGWRMLGEGDGIWEGLYVFGLEQVYPADVALGNYWTSTNRDSHFTTLPTLARHLPDGGRTTLVGNRLSRRTDGREEVRELANAAEVLTAVHDEFAIPLNASDAEVAALWRPL